MKFASSWLRYFQIGFCTTWQIKSLGIFLIFLFSIPAAAQKGGNGTKDIIVRACQEYVGNGIYSATFSYENLNNKDLILLDDNSYVLTNNGKKKSRAVNNFKSGKVDKAFTRQFTEGGSVQWNVINPNGKTHTVIASANSSHCENTDPNDGIIFPVYVQGTGKIDQVIDLALNALAEGNAGDVPSDLVYQINAQDKVFVEIIYKENHLEDVINLLQTEFGLLFNPDLTQTDFVIDPQVIIDNQLPTIDVFFPIPRLLELNQYFDIINFVRTMYPSFVGQGVVASQGDTVQTSDIVRESFNTVINDEVVPVDGRGVKIGVISNSANTQPFTGQSKLDVDVLNGDLPGAGNPNNYDLPVEILLDYPFGIQSDEGRAMMQIIHDVAPGAELSFHTGTISPRSFELGVQALADAGSDLIVDDVTFVTEKFFGVSRIGQVIQNFVQLPGKAYFSSSGNYGDDGYQSVFNPSTTPIVTNFLPAGGPAVAHVFGTNPDGSEDYLQNFTVTGGRTYMIVLQWSEPLASEEVVVGARTDLDMYIVDGQGRLLVSNNLFSSDQDPTEVMVFEAVRDGSANLMITSADGSVPPGLSFRYVAFQSAGLEFTEYAGGPTITGHAGVGEVITVGANFYGTAGSPEPEPFSSFGGMLPDMTSVNVDLSAPDGTDVNMEAFGFDSDGNGFNNFFGTSAAAPHAAGAFALMLSALPTWYPEGLPAPAALMEGSQTNQQIDQVLQLFQQTATPAGNVLQSGAGLTNTLAAFKSIAAQKAQITTLVVEDGKTPSAEPFIVTILGKYFPENPTVMFNGEELEILSVTENEIQARVNPFEGNPALTVNTDGITPTGNDAGVSNPLYFFEDGRFAITITADFKEIGFGQSVEFTSTITGIPEGTTIESLGLPEITFTTPAAFPYPDVNTYLVTPGFTEALPDDHPSVAQVNFVNGLLRVNRLDVEVGLEDASFEYGQPIVLTPTFTYNTDGIVDNEDFYQVLNSSYESTFYPENSLILINVFRPVVNDLDILELLSNGSWMSSESILQNVFRPVVNGMNIIDLNVDHFLDYNNASQDGTTNTFKAVVNIFKAVVNGTDLLSNNVELSVENVFRPVVNDTDLGNENDQNDYSNVFAVIGEADASSDPEAPGIANFYSLNLITGLGVTDTESGPHYIFPGAFLASIAANLNLTYTYGNVTITPATLDVEIEDFLITQGETPDLTAIVSNFNGFVYDEGVSAVFPDGIPYYFVDAEGNEYVDGDYGMFSIRIREPENYNLNFVNDAKLYVNLQNDFSRKIRTYLDCVEETTGDPDGLNFIANYRYENPNDVPVYILEGPENYLSGDGLFEGELPVVFLPGEGTFQIRFDGNTLKWTVISLESANKTSTTSLASANSGRCDAYTIESIESYSVYPNPVQTILSVQKNIVDDTEVQLFNDFGILLFSGNLNGDVGETLTIDMTAYFNGVYILRCVTKGGLQMYTIKKE